MDKRTVCAVIIEDIEGYGVGKGLHAKSVFVRGGIEENEFPVLEGIVR